MVYCEEPRLLRYHVLEFANDANPGNRKEFIFPSALSSGNNGASSRTTMTTLISARGVAEFVGPLLITTSAAPISATQTTSFTEITNIAITTRLSGDIRRTHEPTALQLPYTFNKPRVSRAVTPRATGHAPKDTDLSRSNTINQRQRNTKKL